MLTPVSGQRYRVDDLYDFPEDGNRYEIVRGELFVTPAPMPPHQLAVMDLATRLFIYLRELGNPSRVLAGPADIIYDEDTWLQPDILVVPANEVTREWRTYRSLQLVAEVLSPSSARGDRFAKRLAYLEHGVLTYWVVDPAAQRVDVWLPGDESPRIVSDILTWRVAPDSPELSIELAGVWASIPRR